MDPIISEDDYRSRNNFTAKNDVIAVFYAVEYQFLLPSKETKLRLDEKILDKSTHRHIHVNR